MTTQRRQFSLSLAAAGTALLGFPAAKSQAFPSKPIKIIVPFPVGGTTDIVARLVAQRMSQSMGQAVTVENKAGAGGAIGADAVAKAAPDGYTMLMHNLTFPMTSVAQTLAGRSPFNVDTDLIGAFYVDRSPERSSPRSSRACSVTSHTETRLQLRFDRPWVSDACSRGGL
jgi:hypothetical protein